MMVAIIGSLWKFTDKIQVRFFWQSVNWLSVCKKESLITVPLLNKLLNLWRFVY